MFIKFHQFSAYASWVKLEIGEPASKPSNMSPNMVLESIESRPTRSSSAVLPHCWTQPGVHNNSLNPECACWCQIQHLLGIGSSRNSLFTFPFCNLCESQEANWWIETYWNIYSESIPIEHPFLHLPMLNNWRFQSQNQLSIVDFPASHVWLKRQVSSIFTGLSVANPSSYRGYPKCLEHLTPHASRSTGMARNTSYKIHKYWTNPIYRMYDPTKTTTYNS